MINSGLPIDKSKEVLMSKKLFFAVMILSFLVVLLGFLLIFENRYSDSNFLRYKIEEIEYDRKAKALSLNVQDQLLQELDQERRQPASQQNSSLGPSIKFIDIKKAASDQQCDMVNKLAEQYLEKYSYSIETPNVILIFADCLVKNQKYDLAIEQLTGLIENYPGQYESALALLKLSQVFGLIDKREEAHEVLMIIINNYQEHSDIWNEAKLQIEPKLNGTK